MAKRYQIINVLRKIKPDGTDAPVKIQLLANIKPAPVMEDLDEIMHSFERLEERFAADPELDKILQEE